MEDLEGNVWRILEFCGLELDPACIEFYKTKRSIRTASSEQVRQPTFREGLFQWRNYEPWLGPLKGRFGRCADPLPRIGVGGNENRIPWPTVLAMSRTS